MTFYKQIYTSPLGEMSLVADETGLVGVWFLKQKYFERGLEKATMPVENDILKRTRLLLDDYFSGKYPDFSSLPLAIVGTGFQQRTGLGLSANYSLWENGHVWSDSKGVRYSLGAGCW